MSSRRTRSGRCMRNGRNGETDESAHRTVADAYGLHLEDDRFVFPDVRLEVQDRDGTERTLDLELVTKEYHRGHLSGKAAAGFRMFGGGSRQLAWRHAARIHITIGTVAPMTADLDRCHALEMLGYTARQAQFLVLVALHGGYFLRRHYVAFTGTRARSGDGPFPGPVRGSRACPCVALRARRPCLSSVLPGRSTRRSAKKTIATGVPRNGTPSSAS